MKKIGLIMVTAVMIFAMMGCEDDNTRNVTDGKGGLKLLSFSRFSFDRDGNKNEYGNVKFHYDKEGRLDRRMEDGETIVYEYDEQGQNTLIYNIKYPQYGVVYAYDTTGNVVRKTITGYDERRGGNYETVIHYKYDTSITLRKPATHAHRWIADAHSPLVKKLTDRGGNGAFDGIEIYTNNEHGDRTTWKSKDVNRGETWINNGSIEYTYRDGRIAKEIVRGRSRTISQDGNFTNEYMYATYHTYDSSGNKTLVEYDNDDNGTIGWKTKYTYDEYGNETSRQTFSEEGKLHDETVHVWGKPEQEDSKETLPDFYGYGTIMIYANLKKDSTLYNQYSQMGIAGSQRAFYHGVATCQNYGFSQNDQQSRNVSANVAITIYFDGSSSCTETALLPEHAMYGQESILFGHP